MINYQKNADNGSKFDLLDLIQRYVLSMEGTRYRTKSLRYSTLKSFFLHNRAELPRDASFRINGDKPIVMGKLKIEDVRNVALSMNPTYRAIVLSMFQAGMGMAEFEYWNLNGWLSLREQLRGEPEVIRIDLPGRKKTRNKQQYYTFIGRDAIDAIRAYIPRRPEGATAIFCNQFKEPLKASSVSWTWHEKMKKLGLVKKKGSGTGNRYGMNPHQLRSLFRSQWEKSPVKGIIAEFLMGHQVDPLNYNRFNMDEAFVRGEYINALSMLEIMSSGRPFGLVKEDSVEELKTILDESMKRIEELEKIRDMFTILMKDRGEGDILEQLRKSSIE
jgi:integrase